MLETNWISKPNSSGIDAWTPLGLMPQLISIFITTFLIMILSISYNKKLKNPEQQHEPRGLVLCVEMLIKMIETMVVEILGKKYKKVTLWCLFLLVYIITGNMLSILGFESQASSYTVVLSMAMVAFVGIYYFGIKYQRISFFKKYLFNPLELISQFIPLISMSFRLFGNVVGGSIILGLLYEFLGFIWAHVPIIGPVDLLTMLITPWAHIYFDIFDGSIQAYIFTILTLIYWQAEMHHSSKKEIKDHKRIKTINNENLNSEIKIKNNLKK